MDDRYRRDRHLIDHSRNIFLTKTPVEGNPMRRPTIEHGEVLLEDENASFGGDLYRKPGPHEVVPALIQIIEDLQGRINELELWRQRVSDR